MLAGVLEESLLITGFVGLMMLVIEYVNVLTQGRWQEGIGRNRMMQYSVALLLGATPGCLGAFAVVAMYSHRLLSLGALVGAMIATSGDEAFVMLTLFPGKALLLTAVLIAAGMMGARLTDVLVPERLSAANKACDRLEIHEPAVCECFRWNRIVPQLRDLSAARGILLVALLLFAVTLLGGTVGPTEWNWVRITLLAVTLAAIFIVTTVPEHFLKEHLWNHVVRHHIHRVFLWTFGALLVTWLITEHVDLGSFIEDRPLQVIVAAALVGVIPESGPHLLFVTLFAKGVVPFDVLLTSSIVQDGHGMLPLLAHSRRVFVLVKIINLAMGMIVGLAFHFVGRLL